MTGAYSIPAARTLAEPLSLLLTPGPAAPPVAVVSRAARALLDLPAGVGPPLAPWLAPHQIDAARRVLAILDRHGGALLADAVGLGKSYVALAVARARGGPFALVVPAVLATQWRDLLARLGLSAPIVTHEWLSTCGGRRHTDRRSIDRSLTDRRLLIVDEAHRFRNPASRRYGALSRLAVGRELLLVTATPVHNRLADLCHLFHLFLRDDALTALGVASLRHAGRGGIDPPALRAVLARLVVARSRRAVRRHPPHASVGPALVFPDRSRSVVLRAGPAHDDTLSDLVRRIQVLDLGGRPAAALRLLLLARLASSLAAFRSTMWRLETFAALAGEAAAAGRSIRPRELDRLCPAIDGGDVQLALLPLLLEATTGGPTAWGDPAELRDLSQSAKSGVDPKAAALADLLGRHAGKTLVFTAARATVRHLARCLGGRFRVALLDGAGGRWSGVPASRADVLRAFAPLAQGAPQPPPALTTDVLLATDLASEGLNLQDAMRVVHYDLPWSPARLAQRVGRIDRLGSPHRAVETVTFLPPEPLARAIAIERRLCAKASLQRAAGTAGVERLGGRQSEASALDWCDRLQAFAGPEPAPAGAWTRVAGTPAVVLVVRLGGMGGAGGLVEAIVVGRRRARADAPRGATLLAAAATASPLAGGSALVRDAIRDSAPLLRSRLAALAAARWRSTDRDAPGRRVVPWVLAAARRAARDGDARLLARLDALVGRLAAGMTAGEALLLGDLLEQRDALTVDHVLAWHERLPGSAPESPAAQIELVAAVVVG